MANEKRLIDKEPIKNFIVAGLNNPDRKAAFGYDAIQILAEIEFAPTVDAVEVVRCKDCRYYEEQEMRCDHPEQYAEYCSDCFLSVRPDDFCSYGERRTE